MRRRSTTVVEALGPLRGVPVVVDPVMVSETGAVLLDDDAREALVGRLLPLTTVATPNIPEARALTGAAEGRTQEELARAVLELGPDAVVVTGGHSDQVVDLFFDGAEMVEIAGRAPSRRRLARLGLHPLLGARRPARARRGPRSRPRAAPARSPRPRSPPGSGISVPARDRSTFSSFHAAPIDLLSRFGR